MMSIGCYAQSCGVCCVNYGTGSRCPLRLHRQLALNMESSPQRPQASHVQDRSKRQKTDQIFRHQFKMYGMEYASNFNACKRDGDKIILPQSAFKELGLLEVTYPMTFKIVNPQNELEIHCGVMEFTAPEHTAYLPRWMMDSLGLCQGDIADLRSVKLNKGEFVKLRPHRTKFTTIANPKAALEAALRGFTCLTMPSTIQVTCEGEQYRLDIVETKPGNAILIHDADVKVDFVAPRDYKEPTKSRPSKPVQTQVVDKPDKEGVGEVWGSSKSGKDSKSYFRALSGGYKLCSGEKSYLPKDKGGTLRRNSKKRERE